MPSPQTPNGTVADAPKGNWVDRYAPETAKPYFRMSRLDRPIGYWLLFWPCGFALALAAIETGTGFNWWYLALFLIGAIAMRGAGCTFNDIVDRDIDDKVARTRSRPIPSGQVSVNQAVVWLVAQSLVGLVVLLQFNLTTILMGIASLGLVAIYPFMKRITYWPQLFLGFAFSWGALVGWTAITDELAWTPFILYAGTIAWTIGYDTIYALQDVEDDILIGVKSTALLAGDKAKPFIAGFFALTLIFWAIAAMMTAGTPLVLLALILPAAIMVWVFATLDRNDGDNCLARFKAHHWVGLTFTAGLVAFSIL